jgi:hypothetical protein
MRKIAILGALILTACTSAAEPEPDAGPPAFRELSLVTAKVALGDLAGPPTYGLSGRAVLDADGRPRCVVADLDDGTEVVMGVEPEGDATDWVVGYADGTGARLRGTITATAADGCAWIVGQAPGLYAELEFCE